MKNVIQIIVGEIPKGLIFDSHFVINELIKRFSDEYLIFASKFAGNNQNVTLSVHGQIGKEINKCDNVEQVGEAWSENIHKNLSKCTCWRKK